MYYYASKLTAAALGTGLRGGDIPGFANVADIANNQNSKQCQNRICKCHDINNTRDDKHFLTKTSPIRQFDNFPPPPSVSMQLTHKNYSKTSRIGVASSPIRHGPTTNEHVFVTASIEHPRTSQHHRHRTKQKVFFFLPSAHFPIQRYIQNLFRRCEIYYSFFFK